MTGLSTNNIISSYKDCVAKQSSEIWNHSRYDKFLALPLKLLEADAAVNLDEIYKRSELQEFFCLVFFNGKFCHDNLPRDVLVNIHESSSYKSGATIADFSTHELHLSIPKNTQLKKAICILHLISNDLQTTFLAPKIALTLEQGAKAELIEIFENNLPNSAITNFYNYTFESTIYNNAHLTHLRVFKNHGNDVFISNIHSKVQKDASYTNFFFIQGTKTLRNNIDVALNENGAECFVHGLYLLDGEEVCDSYTQIHHNSSHTHSNQFYKGILKGEARVIFTGNINVKKDSQQITSEQLNKNLVLSNKAQVFSRPQLEVAADDVKCGHGATIGRLSDEEIFYLESRGITEKTAKAMLSEGFALDCIDQLKSNELKKYLLQKVQLKSSYV
jgi:Fe-S cluster assembly protein SufD